MIYGTGRQRTRVGMAWTDLNFDFEPFVLILFFLNFSRVLREALSRRGYVFFLARVFNCAQCYVLAYTL